MILSCSRYSQMLLTIVFIVNLGNASTTYSFNDPHFRYYGRYYTDQQGVRYDWPCFTIQFCFVNATKITWIGIDRFSHYEVILNNNSSTNFIPNHKNKQVIFETSKPNAEVYCIKLVKITEDHFGPLGTIKDAIFSGIEMQGAGSQLVFNDYQYRYNFQFIGDSLTVGFGDMSGTNPLCLLRMRHHENCLQSWATHLSKRFNAEYRVIAQSGKGVVANAWEIPPPVMPTIITKITSNSDPNTYNYQDKYTANATFVFLGVNDYNAWIKPSKDNFVYGYQKMLNQIVNTQIYALGRKPKIIGLCTEDMWEHLCEKVKTAINSFRYAYESVYFVRVPKGIFIKDQMGCSKHPNAIGQRKVAEAIYEDVKKILQS